MRVLRPEGSIFYLYGLLTFARYLGAWSHLGWAWNVPPSSTSRISPSAELIESSVTFLYGATNMWMERFGAEPGSPYTGKQIQHISIAVMFFFGGILGIALELGSRKTKSPSLKERHLAMYQGSLNPFTALCIGITGVAMAAHHQTYVFQVCENTPSKPIPLKDAPLSQVQIHSLWGGLLALHTLTRCMTYILLWLRPPTSTTPSRPPTEILASFTLTAGGIAFISSTEQIGFWAMRTGRGEYYLTDHCPIR